MGKTLAITSITSSPSSILQLNHHPPLLLVEAAHAVHTDASAEWRYGTFEHRPETEEAHTGKPRRHRLFTEALRTVYSGGIGKRKTFFFFFLIFQKKRKIIFKKAESKNKTRNSAEKRKIDIPDIYMCVCVCVCVCMCKHMYVIITLFL